MKIQRLAVVLGLSASLAFMSLPAEASRIYVGVGTGYYGGGYYSGNYYQNCRWMSGHWRHGYWYPARRVCGNAGYYYQPVRYYRQQNYHNGCRWVPGHWRHGYWYPAQRVCW